MTTASPEVLNPLAQFDFIASDPLLNYDDRLNSRFTVVGELGRGGQAMVYQVQDEKIGKRTALKVFTGLVDNEEKQGRAYRDARTHQAMSKISPENVVPFIGDDVIETSMGDIYFLETELMPETLRDRLEKIEIGGISVAQTISIVGPTLDACGDLHEEQGLLFRDLSPGNTFIGADDKGRLGDFGTVRAENEKPNIVSISNVPTEVFASPLTQTNAGFGVVQNLPPEIVKEEAGFSRASDVYGAGVLLHWSLTGNHNIKEVATSEPHMRMLMENYAPTSVFMDEQPDIPEDLKELTLSCLEANPKDRPASMREVAQRLGQIAA